MSATRRVVASPVVSSNTVYSNTAATFAVAEKWGSDHDGDNKTTGTKCCDALNTQFAKFLKEFTDAVVREPQDAPEQSFRELFYNGGLPITAGETDACDALCQAGPNFVAAAKARLYNLADPSRDPNLYSQRAQGEYQSFLLNLTAILSDALLTVQVKSCVKNFCCEALAKQIVAATLGFHNIGRNSILLNPSSYGTTFITDEDTNATVFPSFSRAFALLLIYNQYTTTLNTAFKIAGCTGYCPPNELNPADLPGPGAPDANNLPAQLPKPNPNTPNVYPYIVGLDGVSPAIPGGLFKYPGQNNC